MKTNDQAVARSDTIEVIYRDYMCYNPEEKGTHKLVEEQIFKQSDADCRRATNAVGHVTVSAFVFDKENQRVLLPKHETLQHLPQPSAHYKSAFTHKKYISDEMVYRGKVESKRV